MDSTYNDMEGPTNFSNPLYETPHSGVDIPKNTPNDQQGPPISEPPPISTITPGHEPPARSGGGFKPTSADSDRDTIALVESEDEED